MPPAPDSVAALETGRRGVPRVPAPESDCCARIAERLDCSRDEAKAWVTFLRALELAESTPTGVVRTDVDATPTQLRARFRERVYGVEEVLAVLEATETPLTAESVARRTDHRLTRWERDRRQSPELAWHERVERVLDWAVVLGALERTDSDAYRRVQ